MIEDVKQRRSLIVKRRCDVHMQKQNSINVMGRQNRLKFSGKTNRLKISLIFTILASFVCFLNFPDRNLIILYKIT